MNMKRLASVVMVLGCVSAFAKAPESSVPEAQAPADREVWITVGSDVAHIVNATLVGSGFAAPEQVGQKGEVTAFRVRESQLNLISRAMHDRANRCGGYIYHDTEASALASMDNTAAAQAMSSLAVTYTVDNAATVNALVAGLQEPNIRNTITQLSSYTTRYHTSSTGTTAANWLKSHWESLANGRTDVTVELYTHPSTVTTQPSVIMTIQGTTLPSEVVVLGGHLDSTSSGSTAPGADDDASGIATLTEVIRMAMVQGYRPQRTVKFMAYAAEEVGLRGSKNIADTYKANAVNVVGVLQLDMTNYQGSTIDVAMMTDYTNAAQNSFITNLISTYFNTDPNKITWSNSTCGYACSDHASWTNAGFAASIPFESLMSQYNPSIHTVNDTLARSNNNANHALKFAKVAAAYVAELAKGSVNVTDTTPPTVALTAPASGATVTGTATISATASDASGIGRVDFLVDGQVKGSVTSSPYNFAWDTASTANGSHTVAARAYDGVGNSATSSSVTVTVSNSTSTAGYDSTLKAPRCLSVSSSCDSGTLLNGRGGLGPEVNTPNTINGSCADGLSGTYHSDESNDRIKVSTTDGTPFAAGKTVKIDATVWVYSTTADKLDLYYAANATSPTWTYITTITPTAKGAQTLSATYTLPSGAVQAVRARFRYNGSVAACGTGSYNDHDDLVFAVQ
ncbi:M20/M25/M40 family metallo-hydrolase [Myxococcus sp. RHSTA-1-4]|uniref:M20/M25/M40 family metallo-hydrolase n=1 Tax=Myxococcus sp. RHSTA-1-4 TaxID=2874601 RepID=UPI001CC06272|nr:M20/M25/M40 family metallo-hydrolase [Myxococcus sp. RHSTA-1-4]MBZ4415659.1 M20/M25/M40 family metallo-hydrolase [Myxococcus sp. RHSTA-1-4]